MAGGAAMAFAILWPADLANDARWFVALSWAAFMLTTFWFHGGIALLTLAALAAGVRARWTAAVLLLLGLTAVGPSLHSLLPRGRSAAAGETTLTVMSVNLLYGRADQQTLLREIERLAPDVLVFQEYTRASERTLPGLLGARFPHIVERSRDDAFGQAVYSRLPFAAPARMYPPPNGSFNWADPQIRVEVEVQGVRVAIQNVHVLPPVSLDYFSEQRQQTRCLADLARQELAAAPGRALIFAGDFNATPESSHLAALRQAGLREAHAAAGRWRGATWPRKGGILPWLPGVRLDHVLYTGPLECIGSEVGGDTGSDHRPTAARFVVGPR